MTQAIFCSDTSGNLETGLFYSVEGTELINDFVKPYWTNDWVRSTTGCPAFGSLADHLASLHDCPIDKEHETGKILTWLDIEFTGAGDRANGVATIDNQILLTRDDYEALLSSSLMGTAAIDVSCRWESGETEILYALIFPGEAVHRPWVVVPPTANQCSVCGRGPVFCPGCGSQLITMCCGVRAGYYESEASRYNRRNAILIKIEPGKEVVDASKWEGSDFLNGYRQIVTRRGLQFLLSIHARPLIAEPLLTYVDDCTPEQRRGLDQMAEVPLPPVQSVDPDEGC